MSYFPILTAPDCQGWTTLCNFSPNNWEVIDKTDKYLNVTWAENGVWHSRNLCKLKSDELRTITISELEGIVPDDALPLLSLSLNELPETSDVLPSIDIFRTNLPAWRATLGLSTEVSSVSYQGEIDPFPATGSLLTFNSFMQFGDNIENYLLIANIEKSPIIKNSQLRIYNSKTMELKTTAVVKSNNISVIPLDDLGFTQTDLPLIICKEMSAIPLYFSKTNDNSLLSLEHTHPPASFAIHGKRWDVQKILKNKWFAKESL